MLNLIKFNCIPKMNVALELMDRNDMFFGSGIKGDGVRNKKQGSGIQDYKKWGYNIMDNKDWILGKRNEGFVNISTPCHPEPHP